MTTVYVSTMINAPTETVWAYIRDFNELPKWVSSIGASEIEETKPSDQLGCIRRLTLAESGGIVRERLLTLSDHDYQCTYSILESPLPLTNYVSTLKLTPITDGNRSFAEWTGNFDTEQADAMRDLLTNGVYMNGFNSLKAKFGG